MTTNSFAKLVLGVALSLTLITLAGCSGNSSRPATQQDAASFRADASKMPADARARVQQAQQSGANRAAAGQTPAQAPR